MWYLLDSESSHGVRLPVAFGVFGTWHFWRVVLGARLQFRPYPTCSHALNTALSGKSCNVSFPGMDFFVYFVGSGHCPNTNNAAYKMQLQCVPDSENSLRHRVTTFLLIHHVLQSTIGAQCLLMSPLGFKPAIR